MCGDCEEDTLPAVPQSPPTQESTRLSIAINNSQYGEFRVEASMGSLVNTDTTEADTQEAHSTEANAPHNNSSFEIENIPYQEPTIIQENSIVPSVRNKSGRCPASVGRHTHNHTARPGVATAVEIIKQVKSESSSNVFESASSIVERAVSTNTTTSDPEGSRPVLANGL